MREPKVAGIASEEAPAVELVGSEVDSVGLELLELVVVAVVEYGVRNRSFSTRLCTHPVLQSRREWCWMMVK